MRKLLLIVFSAVAIGAVAQDTTSTRSTRKKTRTAKVKVKGVWEKGGMATIALAQGGTRNWSGGGDRFTLSANGFLHVYANETKGRCHWDNMADANYGLLNSRSNGIIKNDDKLEMTSRLSYEIGKAASRRFRVGLHGNLRTQFTDGYDYDDTEKRRISAFMAPGVLTLSPGGEYYTKNKSFDAHFGPAMRWVIVANRPYELAENFGVRPNREVKIMFGPHLVLNFNKEIMKNIHWRSNLDLMGDALENDPANIDVDWTNMIHMRVNKWLGVVYSFDLLYDDDTRIFGFTKSRPGTQMKSVFGIGASVKF